MPTSCSRLSRPSSVKSGASSWQGTHHDAQTLTTLTLPMNTAGSSPGTWAPSLTRPSSGGSEVCGAGRPIKAEGMREGSPPPSRHQKIAAGGPNKVGGKARGAPAPKPNPEDRGQGCKGEQRHLHRQDRSQDRRCVE